MPKPGFYAVRVGRRPGIYMTWAECEVQVKGFPKASYKKFADLGSAEDFAGVKRTQPKPNVEIEIKSNLNEVDRRIVSEVYDIYSASSVLEKQTVRTSSKRTRNYVQESLTSFIHERPTVKTSSKRARNSEQEPSTSAVRERATSRTSSNRARNSEQEPSTSAARERPTSRTSSNRARNCEGEPSTSAVRERPTSRTSSSHSRFHEQEPSSSSVLERQTVSASSTLISNFELEPSSSSSVSIEEAFENVPDFIFDLAVDKRPYYAVHRGARPGVYRIWKECEAQIKNTRNASYRKFDNEEQALEYVQTGGIVKATKRELREIPYNNRVKKRRRNSDGKTEYVLANPNEPVVIFTDGASAENGRRRARAGIGIYWGPNHPLNTSKRLTGRQTNNRAEIQAAVYALNQAKQIGARKVKLYTDSQFLIHAITDWIKKWKTNGWKLVNGDPVVNKDDFLELEAVSQGLEVEWIYVKAHARNRGNDEADRLAVAGSRLLLEPSNCSEFPKPRIEPENLEPFIVTDASSSSSEVLPLIIPEENIERKPFYAVHKGKSPGVYKTWTECEQQIKDFPKPWFKKFYSEEEALEFVKKGKVTKKINIPDHGPDKFVTVFTDGASSCNGQEDAKAGIGVYWGPGNELNTSMRLPGRQTNNRAEIFAAVHALKQAKQLGIKNLRLYTDSQFVIKGITEWIDNWKEKDWISSSGKPVVNKEDFTALDNSRQGINVDWCYVKGHANNPGNVEADKLAVAGCSKSVSDSFFLA
ncbi:Ribonuclease H1 [Araneus ventricosus]|uniref:Ribonuclease H n=1 Tax=Araneus ventricosus TaxID=182803 RepID=A0A4Y2L9C6_ARAVE|nr:Ribonuclease H1 [Araneus ventricosus]